MEKRSPEQTAEHLPDALVSMLARVARRPEDAQIELLGRPRSLGTLVRAGVAAIPRGRLHPAKDVEITDFGWDVIGACADLELE